MWVFHLHREVCIRYRHFLDVGPAHQHNVETSVYQWAGDGQQAKRGLVTMSDFVDRETQRYAHVRDKTVQQQYYLTTQCKGGRRQRLVGPRPERKVIAEREARPEFNMLCLGTSF